MKLDHYCLLVTIIVAGYAVAVNCRRCYSALLRLWLHCSSCSWIVVFIAVSSSFSPAKKKWVGRAMGNEKRYEHYHTAKHLKNKFRLGKYSFMKARGKYSHKFRLAVCRLGSKALTIFTDERNENCKLLPYLRLKPEKWHPRFNNITPTSIKSLCSPNTQRDNSVLTVNSSLV